MNYFNLNLISKIINGLQSNFIINIPFVFQLKSGSYREEKPELITPESFDALPVDIEDIKTMRLFIDYDNQMGFGADINVLAAPVLQLSQIHL